MKHPSTLLLVFAMGCAMVLTAATARADDSYRVQIRIISAQPTGSGIDAKLSQFQRDFSALPYKSFQQLDSHSKKMRTGETVSMQFPGPGRRFLTIKANGTQDGKHKFKLSIDTLSFSTTVRIPDNGTILVGGPKYQDGVIFLAVSAVQGKK